MKIYLRGLNDVNNFMNTTSQNLTIGEIVRISQTFNVTVADYYTPLFTINSNIVINN